MSYLTSDGKLTATLEVSDLKGGFVGFTGRVWTIEPSGKWKSGNATNAEVEVDQKGELTKEQLIKLANSLAKYDLATLPKEEGGKRANPHVIKIKFGDKISELIMHITSSVPRAVADGSTATVAERFGEILSAVKSATSTK